MKISCSFFLLLSVLVSCGKATKSELKPNTITILAEPTPNDYAGTVSAYYQDEFGDSKSIYFKKNSGGGYLPQTIKSRYPIWLRFTRGAQVPVYLLPGDTLQVKAAPRFNVDYTFLGERPGEISFYNQLDKQSLGMNLGDLMGVHQNEKVFRPRTKMLNYLYKQRKAYLERIKDSLTLSPAFSQFIQTEITGTYLIGLLAPFYREKFSQQSIRQSYLDTLSSFYNSGYFNSDSMVYSSSVYRRSLYFYNRFLSREALGTPREMEVLYENARQKFKGQNRNYLLFSLLKEHLPQDLNMDTYLTRSKKDITYKPYQQYLDSLARRPYVFNTKPEVQNTPLITLAGEQITWRELLDRNKGKVMYVNFWTSWFSPSLDELAASQKLQATLKNQPVSFVYLSQDRPEDKVSWQDSIVARKLTQPNDQHYLLDNKSSLLVFITGQADAFGGYNYLLLDKEGKVVAMEAKHPDNPKLREDILTLLQK